MSTRKPDKAENRCQICWQLSKSNGKQQMQWLLRALLVRQHSLSGAGFVLPTVAMVSLVVVLLTTAMLIRSFDRSRNASNVRVNQAVLNAATPALARARAKIDELFKDPTMPRATPSDTALYRTLNSNGYTFGDETRLKLVYDIDKSGSIQGNTLLENNETSTIAWKFPVDTDNNGLFDSFTLYGIYFRSPTRGANGGFNRARNPLEGRTAPMEEGAFSSQCAAVRGTSTSPVGDLDWYKSGNKLTKSFFVYTATVPITEIGSLNRTQYEQHKGNKGFSALELQQDQVRMPLNNNAVWYEDDIEVSNATTVRINGRVFTNSNLMVAGKGSSNKTIFYQVSDPDSCYYEQENSKIVVGGNVANGDVQLTTDEGGVEIHRFQGKGTAPVLPGQDNTNDGINSTNKTTTLTGGRWVGYNNKAYSERIGLMVQAALDLHITGERGYPTIASVSAVARYPQQLKERFKQRFNDSNETKEPWKILTEELETYFKAHTRRVPYAEVDSSTATTGLGSYNRANVLGYTNPIRPPNTWMAIENPMLGSTTGYTNLPLKFGSNTMYLPTTEPTQQQKDGEEHFIGDRILVGNNLPLFWPKFTATDIFDKFAQPQEEQLVKNGVSSVYWNDPNNGNATRIQRTRQSQLEILTDFGSVERDGFWETEAAKQPAAYENTGGLRVITGAGVYIDGVAIAAGGTGERSTDLDAPKESFLPEPALNPSITDPPKFTTATTTNNDNIIVWPDLMPMWDGNTKGDLQMRAAAVYHYKQGSDSTTGASEVDSNQVPIACVSSYYDPTDETTARNESGLPDVSGVTDTNGDRTINSSDKLADGSTASELNNGRSNNGVTYDAPYTDDTGRISAVNTYRDQLNRQARAIFPNGRIVNESLRKALSKIDDRDNDNPRSLADNAAIDTAICALKILDDTLSVQSSPNVPHGAIKEAAFLDGRQVKSLNSLGADHTRIAETPADLTDRYTLPLEQRQPLEIRVTELDLKLLKAKEINQKVGKQPNSNDNDRANDQEYLLPNSGIIYATREDALPDLSHSSDDLTTQALLSPTDFKLDSTRRANGIRLINGSNLARKNFYRVAEKGLILATNLPAYIKGDFNLHQDPKSNTVNVREEFTEELNELDWINFYTRNNTLNRNFACRQNQPTCADSGDQWRQATIISDAQTLLSNNFWDGFRNQGDYDLNNNQGNSAVEARFKNGFWNNNFVTSANWAGTDGFPEYKNSYLTNGVTPIQRRANFPEYVMEICRKLPASECKPSDWVVGYDANDNGELEDLERNVKATDLLTRNAEADRLGAGTTAKPALQPADRRYARRVAFQREASGALSLSQWNDDQGTNFRFNSTPFRVNPTPLGINTNGQIARFPYDVSDELTNNFPNPVNNALWFRTTNNTEGNPGAAADITYETNKPLYYLPPEQGGEKLFLPNTFCFNNTSIVECSTTELQTGVVNLNYPTSDKPSDYTVCLDSSSSKDYQVTKVAGTPCNRATRDTIAHALTQIGNFDPGGFEDGFNIKSDRSALTGGTLTATAPVVVYDLPANTVESGVTLNLVAGTQTDVIFVLRAADNFTFGNAPGRNGVTVNLQGVSPNNVFWVNTSGSTRFADAKGQPHKVQGNFLGRSSAPTIGSSTQINGGRFLGFTTAPNIPRDAVITAVTSSGQPSLVPVLQIHSPTGTPGSSPFTGSLEENWLQVATTTTANAAFITGDSPSRPQPSESGGGLPNLVRFLENWSDQIAKIAGSFIQYRRSSYASAPFNLVDPTTEDSASLFYTLDGSKRAIYSDSSDTGFRYRGGASEHRTSFFMPPTLAYIFDVALLSQSPDLFGQRFTVNSTNRPSEYLREVGRDDPWVQTLLCAAQGSGTSYSYAVDASERPTTCPSVTSYNDEQRGFSDGGGL